MSLGLYGVLSLSPLFPPFLFTSPLLSNRGGVTAQTGGVRSTTEEELRLVQTGQKYHRRRAQTGGVRAAVWCEHAPGAASSEWRQPAPLLNADVPSIYRRVMTQAPAGTTRIKEKEAEGGYEA